MVTELPSIPAFARSAALFDRDGRLVDCNQGFRDEFEIVSVAITPGASFGDILRRGGSICAHCQHPVCGVARGPDGVPACAEGDQAFTYEFPAGRFVEVRQLVTLDGGLYRVARDVTAERTRQSELDTARHRSRVAVTEVPVWLRREADGHFVYSPPTEELRLLFGVSPEFDLSDPMSLYSRIEQTPAELERYAVAMEQSIRTLSVLCTEFRTHGSDGALRWIRCTENPVRLPDGAILWTGTLRDITREKAAEGQVELLRSVVVHSRDAIGVFETPPGASDEGELPEGLSKFIYINPALERLTGFSAHEVLGKTTADFVEAFGARMPDRSIIRRIRESFSGQDNEIVELAIPSANGARIWVDGRFAIVQRLPDGTTRWVMVLRDITERRHAQEKLLRSQQHLARAQRLAAIGSAEVDLLTGAYTMSDELRRIFGLETDSGPSSLERFLEMIHPDDREPVTVAFGSVDEPMGEFRFIRPDGSTRIISTEREVILDDAGKPVSIVATVQDVTDIRTAQARQAELERQLQHSQRLESLGTLAGGIAHDLNNTLVPILALTKMTMARVPEGSRERSNLELVLRSSEHARDLVKQILMFSRKETAVMQSIDLGSIAREALRMLRSSVPLHIRLIEDVGGTHEIMGDSGKLCQAIINLVTNAVQAIGEEAGVIGISLSDQNDTDADGITVPVVRLTVTDTGRGIDSGTLPRIFEPFFTTKGVGSGTGLGLAIVHGIVTSHGGRITVDTELGNGTAFTVVLPRHRDQSEPAAAAPAVTALDQVGGRSAPRDLV